MAQDCSFNDINNEVKSQIVQACTNRKLRMQILSNANMNLQEILDAGHIYETIAKQANEIERLPDAQINNITSSMHQNKERTNGFHHNRNMSQSNNKNKCRSCGLQFPHVAECPAKGKMCLKCNKPNHFARCCNSTLNETRTRFQTNTIIIMIIQKVHIKHLIKTRKLNSV